MIYIYALRDPTNSYVRYVGKTNNPERRLKAHIQRSKTSRLHSSNWIRNVLKNGLFPMMDILEICNEQDWEAREIFWIAYYRDLYDLTNILDGGSHEPTYGRLGKGWSEQQRQNNRKSRLGVPVKHTAEGKLNRAEGIRKYHSENCRQICQYSLSGQKIKCWKSCVEASKALGCVASNLYRCCSKNSSGFKACEYLWRFPDLCNADIVDAFQAKRRPSRKIDQIDLSGHKLYTFDSITDAASSLSVSTTNISNCLSGRSKTAYGYIWKYSC